jgi:hypothetical protein
MWQKRNSVHKWAWNALRRRKYSRFELLLDQLRTKAVPLDEVSFVLLSFNALLSRRRTDDDALLVVEELAQAPFAHPSFVRFLGGMVQSVAELRTVDAGPNDLNLIRATKTCWEVAYQFKTKRLQAFKDYVQEAAAQGLIDPSQVRSVRDGKVPAEQAQRAVGILERNPAPAEEEQDDPEAELRPDLWRRLEEGRNAS